MAPRLLKTGDLARRFGITPQMVHVYATLGIIRERRRTPAGYRLFGPEAVKRLELARAMIRKGYPLREVGGMFSRTPGASRLP